MTNTNNNTTTTYYLIRNRTLGKREDGSYYLFKDGHWEPDTKNTIMDLLIGFDPSEPEGSPYRTGNLDIMDEIKELTLNEAKQAQSDQTVALLFAKWKQDLIEPKAEWNKNPGWPAKLVKTTFNLNGIQYTIMPQDLGLTDDCWDQGFMESFQGQMKKDLETYGATGIYNTGFLD